VDIQKAGEQMVAEIRANKPLALALSLAFILVIAAGLLIDSVLFFGWREGHLRRFFAGPPPEAPWFVGDVFKVFIVLFFAEIMISVGLGLWSAVLKISAEKSILFLMGGTMLRNVIAALYVLYLVARRYGAGLKQLGFRFSGALESATLGIAAYLGFFPLYLLLLLVIMGILKIIGYEPPLQTVVEVVYQEKNAGALVAASLAIALAGPFFEEMFFRGFVYQAFRRKWGPLAGLVWVSVIFAAMHAHWVAFFPIFALSAVLCVLFESTGSLIPGIALHVFHNLMTLTLMFQVKGFQGP
jgi:membrane protease YdiL (CAAX protease family)